MGNVVCTLPRAVGSFSPLYSPEAVGSGCQNKGEASHAQSSAQKGLWWEAMSKATSKAVGVNPQGQGGAEGSQMVLRG